MTEREYRVRTASGRQVSLTAPDNIHWPDIAEHLAKIDIWSGSASNVFYSHAQRAVLLHDALPVEIKLYGLLSEAHVAYTGHASPTFLIATDVLWPCSRAFDRMLAAIHAKAGLTWPRPDDVHSHLMDFVQSVANAERRDLFGDAVTSTHPKIKPWGWPKAEEMYLDRLSRYVREE